GRAENGTPGARRLRRPALDATAKRIFVREIPPRQRLADHRHERRSLHVVRRELATFDDWDAHGSEVICADLLVGANTLLPRRRRGPPFNLKLGRIPGVTPWKKAGGGG